jgi:hypothetical protein
VIGSALLFGFVGSLAAWLTLAALVSYVAAYTPMKRVSPLALFVGAGRAGRYRADGAGSLRNQAVFQPNASCPIGRAVVALRASPEGR